MVTMRVINGRSEGEPMGEIRRRILDAYLEGASPVRSALAAADVALRTLHGRDVAFLRRQAPPAFRLDAWLRMRAVTYALRGIGPAFRPLDGARARGLDGDDLQRWITQLMGPPGAEAVASVVVDLALWLTADPKDRRALMMAGKSTYDHTDAHRMILRLRDQWSPRIIRDGAERAWEGVLRDAAEVGGVAIRSFSARSPSASIRRGTAPAAGRTANASPARAQRAILAHPEALRPVPGSGADLASVWARVSHGARVEIARAILADLADEEAVRMVDAWLRSRPE
ncbi:protein of unknown function [Candidatus Hydrogenisulfobacillus filiaventi]|uniref:Uncharacterized protein n=1 Tax=Candidatus Hydrogenisulfobacillus filiaventi TaxID=2707344 RepID=A0A6F8ZIF0_9FIRM|nr:protein of unknown function [Candidatus Hydrogenisulfobacillus filiaventi]